MTHWSEQYVGLEYEAAGRCLGLVLHVVANRTDHNPVADLGLADGDLLALAGGGQLAALHLARLRTRSQWPVLERHQTRELDLVLFGPRPQMPVHVGLVVKLGNRRHIMHASDAAGRVVLSDPYSHGWTWCEFRRAPWLA